MKVEIYYEAPDAQILELTDEQAELWTIYSDAVERSRELQRSQGWTNETWEAYAKVDEAYENFEESIQFALDYDMPIDEITEW